MINRYLPFFKYNCIKSLGDLQKIASPFTGWIIPTECKQPAGLESKLLVIAFNHRRSS